MGLELIVRFKEHLENIDFMGKEHIRNAPFFVGYNLDTLLDTHTAIQDFISFPGSLVFTAIKEAGYGNRTFPCP